MAQEGKEEALHDDDDDVCGLSFVPCLFFSLLDIL